MKVGRFDFPADMIGQVNIPTRACRTAATGDRRRGRSLEKTIHAGARNPPSARNPRQAITTRRRRRDRLASFDLLRAKGLLASMAAILADSNSLSMVISPTLDFSRAISSSRSSRSRSFRATPRRRALAPAIRSAWPQRHSLPGRRHPTVRPATNAPPPPSCVGPNSASVLHQRPRGRLRQLWGSAPAPLGLHPCINRHFETSGCGSITAARCLR